MPRKCTFTGKQTRAGRQYTRRGRAKYLGGVGVKVTSKTKRTFKPNLQKVRAVVDGRPKRVTTCVSCLKAGKVKKRTVR